MGDSWQKSVVLITSRADGNSVYGTGFVVHRDERGTYVLTCTHVVDDVSGEEWVNVNDLPAMVIASGPADGVDVAVLRVAGLANEPLLRPYIVDSGVGEAFELAGYYHLDDNPKKKLVFRSLTGKFSGTLQAGPTRDTLVPIWEIEITSNDELRPGNSGSPVVNENHDVIGIVNTRLSSNKKRGWVTPIEALEKVWPEIAPRLFERSGRREEKLNTPPTITPSVPPVQALTETPSTISSQTAVPAPQRTGKQPGDEGAAISIFEGLLEGPIVHELLKHFPPSQTLNYDMGEALEKLRHDEETSAARKQEAIDAAEEAIRQKPDDASVHYNMGNVLYQFGVYKKALDAYNQAIRLDSTFAAAPPYPNALRPCIKQAGYTFREVSRETAIPESTLYSWASGKQVIPHAFRERLAQLIGCTVEELAPTSLIV